ncbi:MAG: sigma-70 family RNA polymerase sigma factor [Planctomycetia bacterium]|nr:sigma-70 family RNA polymerase sigma factor [Planctomycetia bacterium]
MINWDHLVREHGPAVARTAWRILGHAADTEDVVQDVFLEAHRALRTQQVRSWPALLRRIATCQALYRLRQRKRGVPLDGLELAGAHASPEESAQEHELADRLREAVAQLPPRESEVFCLCFFDELPHERIAETLDISTGAVKTALCKARTRLEELLVVAGKGA